MKIQGSSMAAVCLLALAIAGCSEEKAGTSSPAASPAPATASASAPAMAADGGDFLTAVHNAGLPIDSGVTRVVASSAAAIDPAPGRNPRSVG